MTRQKFLAAFLALLMLLSTLLTACAPKEGNEGPGEESQGEKNPAEGADIMQKEDPAEDGVLNLLMVGNSFCYYFTDELYGIADAAGVKMRVCNVYYSGCPLQKHWSWWKNGEANYQFFTYDENGKYKYEPYTLEQCLAEGNWDVISFQDSPISWFINGLKNGMAAADVYLGELVAYTRKQFPQTQIYWHQTWAYQVGYDREDYKLYSVEDQTAFYETIRDGSIQLCEKFDLTRVPSGDAWQLARADARVGDTLCGKDGNMEGDFYHDGDIGGGQYLNACVWFEVLTGQSCVGNTFRPDYPLSEERIAALQQAAHEAVAG